MKLRRTGGAAIAAAAAMTWSLVGAGGASADVVWLCKPGMADNPCEIPQDTTVNEYGKPSRVETPPTGRREVDCFYVYPTVSNQTTPNANKDRDPELESIAKSQAARFSTQCRVFAPIYRQSTLASIAAGRAGSSGADPELAFGDVREAWRDYLAKDNRGRPVVLIGHSQGTSMLRRLLRLEIEPNPAQHRRIVSGLLIGGNVTVRERQLIGGDFRSTPICNRHLQVGCVVAYSTYAKDPPEDTRFGKSREPTAGSPLPGGPGYEIACVDPRPLAGWNDHLRSLTPTEPFATGPIAAGIVITAGGPPPDAETTWVVAPDRATGECRRINGAHVLRTEPVGESREPNAFPDETWGTHLIDVNIAYEALVSLVGQQGERWMRPRMSLARTCLTGGRLRLTVRGRDTEFIRAVSFQVGGRTVARDEEPRFRRTLSRKTVAGGGALTARVSLKLGAPQRIVLKQPPARCG
jgi:hypothetical protein